VRWQAAKKIGKRNNESRFLGQGISLRSRKECRVIADGVIYCLAGQKDELERVTLSGILTGSKSEEKESTEILEFTVRSGRKEKDLRARVKLKKVMSK